MQSRKNALRLRVALLATGQSVAFMNVNAVVAKFGVKIVKIHQRKTNFLESISVITIFAKSACIIK